MDIRHWGLHQNNNEYFIDGINLREIIEIYGTPIHIINEKILREDTIQINEIFSKIYPRFQLFYSYKTNWTPGILKIINDHDIGAEVISPFELWLARKIGVPSNKIIYNGIIKPQDGLEDAIKNPIRLINIDTLREIDDIDRISKKFNKTINLGLRLCPPWKLKTQFGLSVKYGEAENAVTQIIKSDGRLVLKGLLTHTAEGARSSDIFLKEINFMLNFAKYLKERYGIVIEIIDIGGGLGVPSVEYMSILERILNRFFNKQLRLPELNNFEKLESFAEKISSEIKKQASKINIPLPILHMEPGRALVSRAQMMILKIYENRKRGKQKFLITDGGRQNNTFPLGYEKHYIYPILKNPNNSITKYSVVGRICSPADYVSKKIILPIIEKNDYLLIMDTGAYFNSYSNNFSFPRPAIVMINRGKIKLIRQRETFEHLIGMDSFINE
ncbi:MAG: hypothetical protein ACTSWR_02885 [Candidatus Helarchaeota archaeon]